MVILVFYTDCEFLVYNGGMNNTWWTLGKVGLIILAIVAVVALICMGIGRITGIFELSYWGEKIAKICFVSALYEVLIWQGVTMLSAYWGDSLVDTVNGALIMVCIVVSLWKRFGARDNDAATNALKVGYGLLVAMLAWFIVWSLLRNGVIQGDVANAISDRMWPKMFLDFWGLNF